MLFLESWNGSPKIECQDYVYDWDWEGLNRTSLGTALHVLPARSHFQCPSEYPCWVTASSTSPIPNLYLPNPEFQVKQGGLSWERERETRPYRLWIAPAHQELERTERVVKEAAHQRLFQWWQGQYSWVSNLQICKQDHACRQYCLSWDNKIRVKLLFARLCSVLHAD